MAAARRSPATRTAASRAAPGHFPGEGAASADPSLDQATVGLSADELRGPRRAAVRRARRARAGDPAQRGDLRRASTASRPRRCCPRWSRCCARTSGSAGSWSPATSPPRRWPPGRPVADLAVEALEGGLRPALGPRRRGRPGRGVARGRAGAAHGRGRRPRAWPRRWAASARCARGTACGRPPARHTGAPRHGGRPPHPRTRAARPWPRQGARQRARAAPRPRRRRPRRARRASSSRSSGGRAAASRRCCSSSAASTAPTAATVEVAGRTVIGPRMPSERELSALRRREIGFVFQFFHLLPELDGAANVLLPSTLPGADRGAAARGRALITRLGLRRGRRPVPAPALRRRAAALRAGPRARRRPVARAGRRADRQPRRRRRRRRPRPPARGAPTRAAPS